MRISGTGIEVDDFRPLGAELYALTHYHADHRRGLRAGDTRPVLASPLTARLLVRLHAVPEASVRAIAPGERFDLGGGVEVAAFDANHCPGAVMFLFTVGGVRHLHTGDFRYSAAHDREPELFRDIDTLYLDATYEGDDDRWPHPPQEEAIERVLDLIARHPEHTVFLAVYRIGKNRLVEAIARRFGMPVWLPPDYAEIYRLLGMGEHVTTDRKQTRIHAHGMSYFRTRYSVEHAGRERDSIVIIPTGFGAGRGEGQNFHYVPYSEHNSSAELNAFVQRVKPRRIVTTNEPF